MFERPETGTRAVLVGVNFGRSDYAELLAELRLLAESAGITVTEVVEGRRDRPDPALFVGSGKADQVAEAMRATEAQIAIFNHDLTPVQERNLERRLGCHVLDRTALILHIFSQRARSGEGKLQVELAQMRHQATRLVRGWTHLERQKGGIGVRGGPGETQLELDRRILATKIRNLEGRLSRLEKSRGLQRRARQRGGVLSVSLVGYTNAGKSTLFNALTRAGAYTADQLFATLDTTTRRLWLPDAGQVVISDTVGFINRLPHTLVAAFHATLEETVQADLLLHVIDYSSPVRDQQMAEVDKVLSEIGAQSVAQIQVFNKIDLTEREPGLVRDEYGKIERVFLSARTGLGLDVLRLALIEAAQATAKDRSAESPVDDTNGNDTPDDTPLDETDDGME